ncbi:hypothetical protein CEXT_535661 [Caerostris extrusa]|uniref:Uncharacterized protein n=1 Tax=Caerostris extrusa TaxID=172846 RepID=A0AAV4XBJ0_CAEEX|nr:hypothetical protein CEXT_535661 [Caerostris extrusa]
MQLHQQEIVNKLHVSYQTPLYFLLLGGVTSGVKSATLYTCGICYAGNLIAIKESLKPLFSDCCNSVGRKNHMRT